VTEQPLGLSLVDDGELGLRIGKAAAAIAERPVSDGELLDYAGCIAALTRRTGRRPGGSNDDAMAALTLLRFAEEAERTGSTQESLRYERAAVRLLTITGNGRLLVYRDEPNVAPMRSRTGRRRSPRRRNVRRGPRRARAPDDDSDVDHVSGWRR
jgi:hypothetical protein